MAIDAKGLRSQRFAEPDPKGCLFEYVYLARPDTLISGRRVHSVRKEIGRTLAMEAPVDADLVIPTPESGTPSAIGYAEASGIPYGQGLVKNSYVGRTFIQPSQTIRQLGIRLKLNPIRDVIEGKRLVVVDDSIVRGNTQRALVRMLREAGAAEVHVRIASPPVLWPCYFGIDFATRAELIAPGLTTDEICRSIGADSLAYISIEGLTASTGIASRKLCRACFDGVYPVAIPPERAEQMGLEIWPIAGIVSLFLGSLMLFRFACSLLQCFDMGDTTGDNPHGGSDTWRHVLCHEDTPQEAGERRGRARRGDWRCLRRLRGRVRGKGLHRRGVLERGL